MFRIVKIVAICFLLIIVLGAFWFNERNYSRAKTGVSGPTETSFAPGGTLTLDLRAGAYTIRGTANNKIRVRYHFNDYIRDTTSISLKTDGPKATLFVDGPSNSNFRCDIEIPQNTNLSGHLSAGILEIFEVDGNKDLDANAGNIIIDVGDATKYRSVDASVLSGNLQMRPWHTHKPGLFRHFRYNGSGQYDLRASLLAGNLIIDGRQGGAPVPTPPNPDSPKPEPHFD